ncbi:MAG: efflux RND transporter periplasmic adaptor subunit [Terriglobales bacterium]
MNSREKKILMAGAALGVVLAAVLMGAYAFQGSHKHASETALPVAQQPAATQPTDAGEGARAPSEAGATVQLTPQEMNAAGVQTVEVKRGRLKTDVDAFGRVEQPEAQLASLSTRVGGRIEKLYVQYTGQNVRRGQAVAEIYSPEVAASTEEYRLALENQERMRHSSEKDAVISADDLVGASRRKLELWGISAKQIEAAGANRTQPAVPTITMYSTAEGSVVERKVTRGQYVNAGDTLFTVADLSTVWVKADVYESQLSEVRAGQAVEITSEALPNKTIHGQVEFIEPTANAQTRTVPVHVHVANPGMRLRPGMFVRAKFVSRGDRDTLLVPRSAVLETGTRKLVYVARADGVFESREVEVGAPSEDAYPVLRGVKEGEKVVMAGNFLIDSQTRLSGGMTGLFGGSKEYGDQKQNGSQTSETPANAGVKITFATEPDPPKGGAENTFRVQVTDASGKPLPDAKVTVTLVMPAMPSMNMPEKRSSFEVPWMAAHNMYMGRGTVPLAGPWTVTVEVRKDGKLVGTYRTRVSATT